MSVLLVVDDVDVVAIVGSGEKRTSCMTRRDMIQQHIMSSDMVGGFVIFWLLFGCCLFGCLVAAFCLKALSGVFIRFFACVA